MRSSLKKPPISQPILVASTTSALLFESLPNPLFGLIPLPLRPLLDCYSAEVNVQDREDRTVLFWATTKDDIDSSSLPLRHAADVKKPDNRGFSLIHYAKILPSLNLLLGHSADITWKTAVGTTPLHFASRSGCYNTKGPMVKAHAEPSASDSDDTPLICSTHNHQPKSMETLLRFGANPEVSCTTSGLTALHFAVTENQHDIVRKLLSHDPDYTLTAIREQTILHLEALPGDKMTIDIFSQATLIQVDQEARNPPEKSAVEYFKKLMSRPMKSSMTLPNSHDGD